MVVKINGHLITGYPRLKPNEYSFCAHSLHLAEHLLQAFYPPSKSRYVIRSVAHCENCDDCVITRLGVRLLPRALKRCSGRAESSSIGSNRHPIRKCPLTVGHTAINIQCIQLRSQRMIVVPLEHRSLPGGLVELEFLDQGDHIIEEVKPWRIVWRDLVIRIRKQQVGMLGDISRRFIGEPRDVILLDVDNGVGALMQ
jgi:hypothetical protein